ncbi:hypothetical protein HMPREF3088_09180 [Corynebacterium sp. HMSC22B11]|uniref:DUF6779 domain-containing protein n=1 Tax=Corynebacterium sp. HMSC22B11 TaxID=1581056 RepID=UPI0008A2FB25|nr:DUF6779 domain-containing protein [Corynebacterium sp. HMSC22B11]OFO11798.1 hypothetical protein HMPREF3088_09180 [Corynebacterium sp. HMSC22B11]
MSNRENWSQNAAAGGAEQTDGQNSGPRVLMVLLVVLALIASILMLFLDSDLWLKIAVIAALWAAFLGIVLVSKYSSALRAEQKRVNTLERAHRAEMEREVAGHQQREAALKENYTRQLRNQRDEHLEQLRHELISLRAQLAEMSGEELDDEQTAVRARAERIIELDRGGSQPADRRYQTGTSGQAEWKQPQAGQTKKSAARSSQPGASARAASSAGSPTLGHNSEPSSDRRASAFSTGSFAAVKWTGDNTEETTQIPIVVDSSSSSSAQSGTSGAQAAANRGSEAAEPKAAGRGQHEQREAAQAPQQERAAQPAPRTEPAFRAYEPSQAAAEQASGSAQKQAAPQAEQAAKPAADEKRGAHEYRAGRRRADENSEGLTVAELMKRFQQNDKK